MSILNMTRHHPQHSNHHTSSSDSNYQRRRRRPSVSNDGRDAARFTKEEQKMRPIGVGAGQVLVQEKGKVMPVMPVAVTVAAELPTLENLLATSTNINVNNYSNEMLPIHSNSNGNGNAHGNSKRRLYANKSVGEPTNLTKRLNEARVEAQFTHVYKPNIEELLAISSKSSSSNSNSDEENHDGDHDGDDDDDEQQVHYDIPAQEQQQRQQQQRLANQLGFHESWAAATLSSDYNNAFAEHEYDTTCQENEYDRLVQQAAAAAAAAAAVNTNSQKLQSQPTSSTSPVQQQQKSVQKLPPSFKDTLTKQPRRQSRDKTTMTHINTYNTTSTTITTNNTPTEQQQHQQQATGQMQQRTPTNRIRRRLSVACDGRDTGTFRQQFIKTANNTTAATAVNHAETKQTPIPPLPSMEDLLMSPTKFIIQTKDHGIVETHMTHEQLLSPNLTKVVRRMPNGNLRISPKKQSLSAAKQISSNNQNNQKGKNKTNDKQKKSTITAAAAAAASLPTELPLLYNDEFTTNNTSSRRKKPKSSKMDKNQAAILRCAPPITTKLPTTNIMENEVNSLDLVHKYQRQQQRRSSSSRRHRKSFKDQNQNASVDPFTTSNTTTTSSTPTTTPRRSQRRMSASHVLETSATEKLKPKRKPTPVVASTAPTTTIITGSDTTTKKSKSVQQEEEQRRRSTRYSISSSTNVNNSKHEAMADSSSRSTKMKKAGSAAAAAAAAAVAKYKSTTSTKERRSSNDRKITKKSIVPLSTTKKLSLAEDSVATSSTKSGSKTPPPPQRKQQQHLLRVGSSSPQTLLPLSTPTTPTAAFNKSKISKVSPISSDLELVDNRSLDNRSFNSSTDTFQQNFVVAQGIHRRRTLSEDANLLPKISNVSVESQNPYQHQQNNPLRKGRRAQSMSMLSNLSENVNFPPVIPPHHQNHNNNDNNIRPEMSFRILKKEQVMSSPVVAKEKFDEIQWEAKLSSKPNAPRRRRRQRRRQTLTCDGRDTYDGHTITPRNSNLKDFSEKRLSSDVAHQAKHENELTAVTIATMMHLHDSEATDIVSMEGMKDERVLPSLSKAAITKEGTVTNEHPAASCGRRRRSLPRRENNFSTSKHKDSNQAGLAQRRRSLPKREQNFASPMRMLKRAYSMSSIADLETIHDDDTVINSQPKSLAEVKKDLADACDSIVLSKALRHRPTTTTLVGTAPVLSRVARPKSKLGIFMKGRKKEDVSPRQPIRRSFSFDSHFNSSIAPSSCGTGKLRNAADSVVLTHFQHQQHHHHQQLDLDESENTFHDACDSVAMVHALKRSKKGRTIAGGGVGGARRRNSTSSVNPNLPYEKADKSPVRMPRKIESMGCNNKMTHPNSSNNNNKAPLFELPFGSVEQDVNSHPNHRQEKEAGVVQALDLETTGTNNIAVRPIRVVSNDSLEFTTVEKKVLLKQQQRRRSSKSGGGGGNGGVNVVSPRNLQNSFTGLGCSTSKSKKNSMSNHDSDPSMGSSSRWSSSG